MHAELETLIRKQIDLTWQRDLEETAARTDEAISATIMRFAAAGQSCSSPLYKAVAKLASEEGKGLLLRRLNTATGVLHDAGEDLTPRWADAIASSVLEGIDAWARERAPILRDRLEPLGCGAMCAPVEVLVEDLRRQIGREIEMLKNKARLTQARPRAAPEPELNALGTPRTLARLAGRVLAGTLFAIVWCLGVALLPAAFKWHWLLGHQHRLQLTGCACLIGVGLAGVIFDPRHRTWWFGGVVLAAVLTLLGGLD